MIFGYKSTYKLKFLSQTGLCVLYSVCVRTLVLPNSSTANGLQWPTIGKMTRTIQPTNHAQVRTYLNTSNPRHRLLRNIRHDSKMQQQTIWLTGDLKKSNIFKISQSIRQ